ncbi:hypothetical protein [Marinomonas fungiae]|uniref:Uncharacterized protein n=1 Tax=Marinomonas fungiae TaxID=1137284 RepID=A0A0K6IVB2_9GAMM|nr:hypothetical protein [Marinomonas fungiae]CUB07045.1 hypothetical protein Ga0061065_1314 [Marinomonas fungiae]
MASSIEISKEHIVNSNKAIVFRGRPSAYLKSFKSLLNESSISSALYDFLYTCCEATDSDEALINEETYILVDQHLIERFLAKRDLPNSRGTLVQRFQSLIECSIAEESECIFEHTQRIYKKKLYILYPPFEISSLINENIVEEPKLESIPSAVDSVLKTQKNLINSHQSPSRAVITKILNDSVSVLAKPWYMLALAWRQSTRHKSPGAIEHQTYVHKCPITIRSTSADDLGIASIDDDLLILTIVTNLVFETIKQQVELEITPTNEFFIDIVDICKIAKGHQYDDPNIKPSKYTSGSIRAQFIRSLMRLNQTNNQVIIGNSENATLARQLLGLTENNNYYNKRFITELEAQLDQIEPNKKAEPRWFKVSIDSDTYKGMLNAFQDKNSLLVIAHSELLGYTNGIIHLLYQFLNVVVGRANKPENEGFKTFSTEDLHHFLAPNSSEATFRKIFLQGMKNLFSKSTTTGQWNDNGVNQVTALGYHMIFHTADAEIVSSIFSRDRTDHITGDRSKHNRLLKKQFAALSNAHKQDMKDNPEQQQLFLAGENNSEERIARQKEDSNIRPPELNKKEQKAQVNAALSDITDMDW